MLPVKKILCPVDFLKHSELVAAYAASFGAAFSAEIEVLYVSPVLTDIGGHQDTELKDLQKVEKELLASSGVTMDDFIKKHFSGLKVSGKVVMGNPGDEIVAEIKASKPDLVIMGTEGRSGVGQFFFGSVASKVVRMSPVPVMTLRQSGEA